MILNGEFIEGRFIDRPNRFLSLVKIGDREEYAHLPNPGRIKELLLPGMPVILKKENGTKRKTRYTLIMVYKDDMLVSLNTTLPNSLAAEAIAEGRIEEFQGYQIVRREVKYKNSRFDLLLSRDGILCFLEVKSVTLVETRIAMVPDAPTLRGVKHIHHLMEAMNEGYEASILFIVQRQDADSFTPKEDIDPEFARALRRSYKSGVKICAYTCRISAREAKVDRPIDVLL